MNYSRMKTSVRDTVRPYMSVSSFIELGLVMLLAACGGGGASVPATATAAPSTAPSATLTIGVKQLQFSWPAVSDATSYKLLENADGVSGFSIIQNNITTTSANKDINVISHNWANARYIVEACNSIGCTDSSELNTMGALLKAVGYVKASNTGANDWFGWSVALSGDGRTLAVGARHESSNATGINGDETNNTALQAGAVYVFRFNGSGWSQQAYLKGSNTEAIDQFGTAVALSSDGNTLAVGASAEDSNATGINGNQADNSLNNAGAVYLFRFAASAWSQQAYIKASNPDASDLFGSTVAVSDDGNSLAVSATGESSNTFGVNGNQADNSLFGAGAVYLFRFAASTWSQQAYIKASNPDVNDLFGWSLAMSGDSATLAVGARNEDSNATGINGNQADNSTSGSGAVYLFRFAASAWSQQAYIKSSIASTTGDSFGYAVALSDDGNTLAVGAINEDSNATGINGNQADNSASATGAVYVFRFATSAWAQQAYVKASNPGVIDYFGDSVALSSDGNKLAVGAYGEDSNATGINGLETDNSSSGSGAVYLYSYAASTWSQKTYLKASNTGAGDNFGGSNLSVNTPLALSNDGNTLAVGAHLEASNATGVNLGDAVVNADNSAVEAGAVYLY